MKKIFVSILLILPIYLFGQNWTGDNSTARVQTKGKNVVATDSLIGKFWLAKKVTSLPSTITTTQNTVINYKDSVFYVLRGSSWLPIIGYTAENIANKGAANGYASLVGGKIPSSQIGSLGFGYNSYVVNDTTEMLALDTAQVGDVCIVNNDTATYILRFLPDSIFSNWLKLKTQSSVSVISVNGQTDIVVLNADSVGAIPVGGESDPIWLVDSANYYVKSYVDALLNYKANKTTTINGHNLSSNVVVSASDLTTGTLPHSQLPTLVGIDIPNNSANTTGTAAGLTSQYIDWDLTSGGASIKNKPTILVTKLVTVGSSDTGAVKYNGIVQASGQFDGGISIPIHVTHTLNYDGIFSPTYLNTYAQSGSGNTFSSASGGGTPLRIVNATSLAGLRIDNTGTGNAFEIAQVGGGTLKASIDKNGLGTFKGGLDLITTNYEYLKLRSSTSLDVANIDQSYSGYPIFRTYRTRNSSANACIEMGNVDGNTIRIVNFFSGGVLKGYIGSDGSAMFNGNIYKSTTDTFALLSDIDGKIARIVSIDTSCNLAISASKSNDIDGVNSIATLSVFSNKIGTTYSWTGPDFTSTEQNPMIDSGGIYIVIATKGYCIDTASILVKEYNFKNDYGVVLSVVGINDTVLTKNYHPGISEGSSGTVTTISVATANGISGTVANATTTPVITINPDSVNKWQTKTAANLKEDKVNKQNYIGAGNSTKYPTTSALKAFANYDSLTNKPNLANDTTKSSYLYGKIVESNKSGGLFLGDSYMDGTGSTPFEGMASIIANTLRLTSKNLHPIGGTGFNTTVRQIFNYNATVNSINSTFITSGFNDVYRACGNTKLKNNIHNAVRSLLANQFLATAVAANDASVTYSGTWNTTFPYDSAGLKCSTLSGLAKRSFANASTASYTFTGSSVVVGFATGDGVNYIMDNFIVTIDGTNVGTYNFNNACYNIATVTTFTVGYNKAGQGVLVFQNLNVGSHTIVITKGSNTGAQLVIDYFGTLRSPAGSAPILFSSIPYFTAYAKNSAHTDYNTIVTNAGIDTLNNIMLSEIKAFQNYPATIWDVRDYFKTGDYYSDSIHPNYKGHLHYAQGFLNRLITTSNSFYEKDGTLTGTRHVGFNANIFYLDSLFQFNISNYGRGIKINPIATGFNITSVNPSSTYPLTFAGFTKADFGNGAYFDVTNSIMKCRRASPDTLTTTKIEAPQIIGVASATLEMKAVGLNTSKAGIYANGASYTQYISFCLNEGNSLGSTSANYGGSIYLDSRGGQAPINFFVKTTGTTSSTYAGQIGANGKWQLGPGTNLNPAVGCIFNFTDAVKLPLGTTAQRPTGAAGYLRDNSDSTSFEYYNSSAWHRVALTTDLFHLITNDISLSKTIIAPGTTGDQTINKASGRVNIATAGTSITITNSLVTANSIITVTLVTVDATAKSAVVVAGTGSFVITLNAACTGEVAINFRLSN